MQYLREPFLIILIGVLMTPIILFAVPHEPSPAGGGWLELNPKLGLTQTEAPWFPELTGTLTIEAWIYVDETLPKQVTFSLVGQTDRFGCFMFGLPADEDRDNIMDTRIGVFSNGTKEPSYVSKMESLPIRQWVHYVATIDRGAAIGSDGLIRGGGSDGSELPVPIENRLVLGGTPTLTKVPMPDKMRFAAGVYIDELRISSVVRYKGNYDVPTHAFTADTDTIGLYHFDEGSAQRYEDSSKSQIPLIRSEIAPEVLAENEKATTPPVLSKSEAELLQLIREGIAYYDALLKSGRVDFLRETTSVAADGLPEMPRVPSGTWKGTFEFSGRKMRCLVTQDVIQYEIDRNIPLKGTEQYAYDGETFERLRETFNGMSLSRRSEIVDDPSDDPRFWGWNLSGQDRSLVMLIDGLDVESIKEVRLNDSAVYHIKGDMLGTAIELWLNPKKSYRPERYKVSNPMLSMTKDFKFKEVAPDLWFPESAKWVNSVTDMKTGTKTDASTTTVQFTNIRINEPIPESRFSIKPPPGARGYDMRTRESFEVPEENNK
ncbi:MAG: hypothetical protein OXL96_24390 [Candidatus Poribacteria bacterium]|nr:hypothetical protein [Candidatus Poribacteria bacterium]